MFSVNLSSSDLDGLLKKAQQELDTFYEFTLNNSPKLFVTNNWDTVDALWDTDGKSNNIFGWSNGYNLFVVSEYMYKKETENWYPEDTDSYYMLIKHEILSTII